MTPDLAVRERRLLYSLVVGARPQGGAAAVPEATARLMQFGLVKADESGKLTATEAGREWLRRLLKPPAVR